MSDYSLKYFLLKVKARCNINCTYCYEYNLADQSWRNKPGSMSFAVVEQTAKQIGSYVIKHNLKSIHIGYHGGEPLLLPISWYEKAQEIFAANIPSEVNVSFGLQTNGILLTSDYLKALKKLKIFVGISLDGTKEANDRFRLDFQGKSTLDTIYHLGQRFKII